MKEFITYKNIKIGYSSIGKGSAVVLLHGFLEELTMWTDIADKLSKTYRVISIDLLGHGDSECLGYVHSMEEQAEVVKAVLKHLRLRRASIVGHSMGGYVAIAFAEKYPEVVKKLVLMNSSSKPDSEERKQLRLRAIGMAKTNYKALVQMSVANLFAKNVNEKFANEIEIAKEMALKTTAQGYVACSQGMIERIDREHILTSNDFKTLFVIGKNDPIRNSSKDIEEAKRTNSEYVELSNGHMSHIENKPELIIALKEFLK